MCRNLGKSGLRMSNIALGKLVELLFCYQQQLSSRRQSNCYIRRSARYVYMCTSLIFWHSNIIFLLAASYIFSGVLLEEKKCAEENLKRKWTALWLHALDVYIMQSCMRWFFSALHREECYRAVFFYFTLHAILLIVLLYIYFFISYILRLHKFARGKAILWICDVLFNFRYSCA